MSDHVLVVEYFDGWEYSTACDHPSGGCDDELGLQPGRYQVRVVPGDGPGEIHLEPVDG